MLRPMFGHRPKPKKFDPPLRFYDPDKDRYRRQHRIKIERQHPRTGSNQGLKVVMYAAALGLVVWMISVL